MKPKGRYLVLLLVVGEYPYVWQYWISDTKDVNADFIVDSAAKAAKMRSEDFRGTFTPSVSVVDLKADSVEAIDKTCS
jgi:hypothetical protein